MISEKKYIYTETENSINVIQFCIIKITLVKRFKGSTDLSPVSKNLYTNQLKSFKKELMYIAKQQHLEI